MMSNALSFASAMPGQGGARAPDCQGLMAASAPSEMGKAQIVLLALGICLLVVWVIRRLAYPAKFSLRRSPDRPNRLTPIHILVPLLLLAGLWSILALVLKHLHTEDSVALKFLPTVLDQSVLLASSLLIAAYSFRAGLSRGLGLSARHWPWDILRAMVAYLIVFPIAVGLLHLTTRLLPPDMVREHSLITLIRTSPRIWQVVGIFSAVVLAPVAEEVFFRGLLQSMLRKYTRNAWAAILISSALFAAIHYPFPQGLPALLALGVVLGYNYARTGRLIAPIVIHALFNGVNIALVLTGG